uniref:Transmembrane protein n=1 Tax=Rhabditophanes sp. KR3021 TaxID=114890 RepID=A0AC35U754_9BILA
MHFSNLDIYGIDIIGNGDGLTPDSQHYIPTMDSIHYYGPIALITVFCLMLCMCSFCYITFYCVATKDEFSIFDLTTERLSSSMIFSPSTNSIRRFKDTDHQLVHISFAEISESHDMHTTQTILCESSENGSLSGVTSIATDN